MSSAGGMVYAAGTEWQLSISQILLTAQLDTTQLRTAYDGSTYTEHYHNAPQEGNCYAIATIEAAKINATSSLNLSGAQLVIEEVRYSCAADSSFLVDHNITPLHYDLITSDSGAIVFEIPKRYLNTGSDGWYIVCDGITSNVYSETADPSNVPLRNKDADQQLEIEQTVLSQYEARGKATLDDAMVIRNMYGNTPLSAVVLFETDAACSVTVTVKGHTADADISYTVPDVSTHHEVPVIGLYPDENNRVTVTASDGRSTELLIKTDALPDKMTTVTPAEGNRTETIADGQLYFLRDRFCTVFDRNGEIRWCLDSKFIVNSYTDATSIVLCEDNTGLWIPSYPLSSYSCEFVRITWTGKIERQFFTEDYGTDHDATLLPNGHLLFIRGGTTADPQLIELDPESGKLTEFLRFRNLLDPSAGNLNYENWENQSDWLHANTVQYVAANNSLLLSFRNQHMVMDLDLETKKPIWVMTPASERDGNGEALATYQPAMSNVLVMPDENDTSFDWFYCQHDASFVSYDEQNQLFDFTLFDNGSYRWIYGKPENDLAYSRVVHYQVDLADRSVRQVFEYGAAEGARLHSKAHGSGDLIAASDNYLGMYRCHNAVVGGSIVKEVAKNGEPVAEFLIDAIRAGSYRVDALFFSDKSFRNQNIGQETGIQISRFSNAEWTECGVPGNAAAFSKTAIREIYHDGTALYLYGTARVTDTNTSKLELIAVNESGKAYGFSVPVCNTETGDYYGRGIPLTGLPDGAYELYLKGFAKTGDIAIEDTGYVLRIGASYSDVDSTDLLLRQEETDEMLQAMKDSGNYMLRNPLVVVDPYGISPLSAVALFSTDKPAAITVSVASKNGAAALTQDLETAGTEHCVPIYGLYSGEETQVTLIARYTDGSTEQKTLSVTGGQLPAGFSPIGVVSADAGKMAEGWTFIAAANVQGYLYAVDESGAVRWLLGVRGLGAPSRMVLLENGHLLLAGEKNLKNYVKFNLQEMDLLGRIYHEYLIDNYHHGMAEGPDGNIIALVGHYADGNEDTLCEIDRNTGEILRYWDMDYYFDVDNKNENGVHIADVNYNGTDDWLHTNALDYSAEHNSVIISGRQQDAVIELSLDTGEINWVLTDPDDAWPGYLEGKLLTPQGDEFEWQYGNHCCSYLPNGDILLFDNGDYRSKAAEGIVDAATEGYSRAVVYRIDRENMTVQQIWQFGKELGPETLAAYVSGAYYLGEDDYLINFGGIVKDAAGNASYNIGAAAAGSSGAQIFEVRNGEVVFHAKQLLPKNGHNLFQANRFRPYQQVGELDLTQKATRLGALFHLDEPAEYSFDPSAAVTGGPDIEVSFNGVQLITAGKLDAAVQSLGLIFTNGSKSYRAAMPAGTSLAGTRNASNLPAGEYTLYLEADGTVYDLQLRWNNTAERREPPASFRVTIDAAEDLSYGEGEYYENTPFVVSAPAGSEVKICPNGGTSFAVAVRDLSGRKLSVAVKSEDGSYTFAMPDEDVSVLLTAGSAAPEEEPDTPAVGPGSAGGGGLSDDPAEDAAEEGEAQTRRFVDVSDDAYYAKAVDWAVNAGITNGTDATHFSPDATCTRAQMMTFLWIASGKPEPKSAESPFTDVKEAYYTKAVLWAVENDYTAGVSKDLFGPDLPVTRAQAMTFLYGVAGRPEAELAADAAFFEDVADTDYFAAPVVWAYTNGITSGTSKTTFGPHDPCTRAQIVTFLYLTFAE